MGKVTLEELRDKQAKQKAAISKARTLIKGLLDFPEWNVSDKGDLADELAEHLNNNAVSTVTTAVIEDMDIEDVAELIWWMADKILYQRRRLLKMKRAKNMTLADAIRLQSMIDRLADDNDFFGPDGMFSDDEDEF